MVSFSKLLDLGLRDAKCKELYHPGQTCTQFMYKNSHHFLITPMKYFLPAFGAQLLMKGWNINKKHFWDSLRFYLEAVFSGMVIGQSISFTLCGTRAAYGRFSKYSVSFIPTLLGTFIVYFTSAKLERLFASSIFQVTLETFLCNGKNPVCQAIVKSKPIQTFIFMLLSAFVLHTTQKYGIRVLWMIQSIPPAKPKAIKKCGHDESCSKFCLKDIKKSVLIGIALDLFKTLAVTNPNVTIREKLLRINVSTTLFLTSYTTIYRVASCLLTNTWNADPQIKHIIAAFLGGISFTFLNRLALLCYGSAICVEISWKLFKNHKFSKEYQYLEKVKNFPISRIFANVLTAYLVHLYIFHSQGISQMGVAIVQAMNGNQTSKLRRNYYRYVKSLI